MTPERESMNLQSIPEGPEEPEYYPEGPLSCADCRFFKMKMPVAGMFTKKGRQKVIQFGNANPAYCSKGMFMEVDENTEEVSQVTFLVNKKFWSQVNNGTNKPNAWELANRCLCFDNMKEDV